MEDYAGEEEEWDEDEEEEVEEEESEEEEDEEANVDEEHLAWEEDAEEEVQEDPDEEDESEFVFMPPCDIRFAQDNVGQRFRNGRSLENMVWQLLQAGAEKRRVTMMRVVLHDDGLHYTLDNRRLAAFRLLQMLGRTRIVKASVVPKDEDEWKAKFKTKSHGVLAWVRGTEYAIGIDLASTTFPVDTFRRASKVRYRPSDSEHQHRHKRARVV
mmetsp:Transcript_68972/g.175287  ORF Transcript_68972/g.175287 Transcript_68972/m.175287 type:complete len:213 (-) Transcript_68972:211-849(-)